MNPTARAVGGLRALLARTRVDRELDEELRQYLEAAVEEKVRGGMSDEAARRAARVEIGSLEAVKDGVRDIGWESRMETLWRDVQYALRMLRASPGFTAIALLTLALGIGANTAIFGVVNSLLLRPLPVKDPEQLVVLVNARGRSGANSDVWEQLRQQSDLFDGLLAWSSTQFSLGSGGQTHWVDGITASGSFFETLGVRVVAGRVLSERDDRPGGGPDGPVAVISYSLWQRRFSGSADAIGLYARDQPRPVHHRRRHATGLLRSGRRPELRRDCAARRLPAPDVRARHFEQLALGDGAAETRTDARGRGCRARCRAGPDASGGTVGGRTGRSAGVHRAAGSDRVFTGTWAIFEAALHRDGRGGARPAHRLCQPREPAARARHRSTPRAERTAGARRIACAHRPAAAHREPGPCRHRRGRRRRHRLVGQSSARAAVVDGSRAHDRTDHVWQRESGPRFVARLADARLHDCGHRRGRDYVRSDAGPSSVRHQANRGPQRQERRLAAIAPGRWWDYAHRAYPVAGRVAGRALARPGRCGWPSGAHVLVACDRSSRLRTRPRARGRHCLPESWRRAAGGSGSLRTCARARSCAAWGGSGHRLERAAIQRIRCWRGDLGRLRVAGWCVDLARMVPDIRYAARGRTGFHRARQGRGRPGGRRQPGVRARLSSRRQPAWSHDDAFH